MKRCLIPCIYTQLEQFIKFDELLKLLKTKYSTNNKDQKRIEIKFMQYSSVYIYRM